MRLVRNILIAVSISAFSVATMGACGGKSKPATKTPASETEKENTTPDEGDKKEEPTKKTGNPCGGW